MYNFQEDARVILEDERSSEYKAEPTTEMQWKDLAPTPPPAYATGQSMAQYHSIRLKSFTLKFSYFFSDLSLSFSSHSFIYEVLLRYFTFFNPHPNR